MAQQRESAPSGIGGLVRYEEEKSKVLMKPEYIFLGVAAIAEIELVFQGLVLIAAAFGIMFGLMLYWMYGGRIVKFKTAAVKTTAQQPAAQAQTAQQVQQNVGQQ